MIFMNKIYFLILLSYFLASNCQIYPNPCPIPPPIPVQIPVPNTNSNTNSEQNYSVLDKQIHPSVKSNLPVIEQKFYQPRNVANTDNKQYIPKTNNFDI